MQKHVLNAFTSCTGRDTVSAAALARKLHPSLFPGVLRTRPGCINASSSFHWRSLVRLRGAERCSVGQVRHSQTQRNISAPAPAPQACSPYSSDAHSCPFISGALSTCVLSFLAAVFSCPRHQSLSMSYHTGTNAFCRIQLRSCTIQFN